MSIIREYLFNEKKMTEVIAKRTEQKVSKYDDIRKEFEYWIEKKAYNLDNPLIIGGYSAKSVFDLAPFLDGLGVFNFLVTLREDPDRAKKYIDEGFKSK